MNGTPGFEVQLMDAGKRPMFVVSMVGFSEEQVHDKALELLSLHGGESFTVRPQSPSLT